MLARTPGFGQFWIFDSGRGYQDKGGSYDGGGLQAEDSLPQADRNPAGGKEVAPLLGGQTAFGADEEGAFRDRR